MTTKPILVIEDDTTIAVFLEWVLTSEGHTVILAEDDVSTLRFVAAEQCALILMDMNIPCHCAQPHLPGEAGLHLYQKLRQRHIDAPTVAMTADPHAADMAITMGMADKLLKPFDVDDLLAIVTRYTGLSHD